MKSFHSSAISALLEYTNAHSTTLAPCHFPDCYWYTACHFFRVFWLTVSWSSKGQPRQAQKVINSIVFQFNLNTADNNNANANTNNNNANIVNVMPPGKKKRKRRETGSQEETDRDRKCPRSRDRGLADASLATALLLQVDIFLALLNKTYPSYFWRYFLASPTKAGVRPFVKELRHNIWLG